MFDEDIECQECGWQGFEQLLVCSKEDAESNKPVDEIAFIYCPECGSEDICDIGNEDE